ncbi:MAG: calcium-binding protein [Thermoleophilaceae bacterium]
MRLRLLALPVVALLVAILVPASAFAASGQLTNCDPSPPAPNDNTNCTMVYTGGGTEANNAVVALVDSGTNFQVHDPNASIAAQSPCFTDGIDVTTMKCPTDDVARFSAQLGNGNDTIQVAASLPSFIEGGGGSDALTGSPVNDTIYGDNQDGSGTGGDDNVRGGQGNDTLFGGQGNDTFPAEAGSDGADEDFGGTGVDTATFAARTAPVQLSLDDVANDGLQASANDNIHTDVENLVGGSAGDLLTGSAAANGLDGGAGDDSIAGFGGDDNLTGADGNDSLDGGGGNDAESGGTGNDTLAGADGNDTESGGSGDDTVAGGDGGDGLAGDDGNDALDGGSGDDGLSGGAGGDSLAGGDGVDSLDGGADDDSLDGGTGPDVLAGGDGTDVGNYGSRTAPLTITLDGQPGDGDPGEGDNVEPDVENLRGGTGNDTLIGSAAANGFDGGGGENYEDGGGGPDALTGGPAGDVVRTRGSAEGDSVNCGPGPDFVIAKPTDSVSADCDRVDRGVNQKPKLRDSAVVAPARGPLQMSPAGIVRRVPLQDTVVLPLRSVVDTVAGAVKVTSSASARKTQAITLSEGAFDITQTAAKLAVTQFALVGGDLTVCPAAARAGRARAAKATVIRHLWANGKGNFRTRGRYAAASIRGTKWLTADRCDGTLIRVASGAVTVKDLVRHKTVVVKAGKSYFAAAKRAR